MIGMVICCVTGSRDAKTPSKVFRPLDNMGIKNKINFLMHGGATGVDSFADIWARRNGIQPIEFPALWSYHLNAAGPIRNNNMSMFLKPGDYLVVFPGGKGTAQMRSNGLAIRGLNLITVNENGDWETEFI